MKKQLLLKILRLGQKRKIYMSHISFKVGTFSWDKYRIALLSYPLNLTWDTRQEHVIVLGHLVGTKTYINIHL